MHECTEDEVTKEIFDNGHLHICLPTDILRFRNDFNFMNEESVAFRVRPNYDKVKNKNDKDAINIECENFSLGRS